MVETPLEPESSEDAGGRRLTGVLKALDAPLASVKQALESLEAERKKLADRMTPFFEAVKAREHDVAERITPLAEALKSFEKDMATRLTPAAEALKAFERELAERLAPLRDKVTGRNKAANAGPLTADDLVETIRQQHAEVERRLKAVAGANAADREDEFRSLVRLLAVHETAEQLLVYPALREMGSEASRLAAERVAEEEAAKQAIARLESMDFESEEFAQEFLALQTQIEGHASAEESRVLPLLAQLDDDRAHRAVEGFRTVVQLAPSADEGATPAGSVNTILGDSFETVAAEARQTLEGPK